MLSAAALLAAPASGQIVFQTDSVNISWKASNDTIQSLPHKIQSLTLSLLNSGVLRTRLLEVPAGDPRVSVLFHAVYPYLTWTDVAASLLCDLNFDQCKRPPCPDRPCAGVGACAIVVSDNGEPRPAIFVAGGMEPPRSDCRARPVQGSRCPALPARVD